MALELKDLETRETTCQSGGGWRSRHELHRQPTFRSGLWKQPHLIDVQSGTDTIIPVKTSQPKIHLQQTGQDQLAISLGELSDDSAMSHNLTSRGSLIAVGRGWYGKPAFVDVFDLEKTKAVGRFKPKNGGTQASFSSDGSVLAIEGAKEVTLWKIADGKQFSSLKGSGIVEF